jgi:two-component system LytT family response regulator
VNARLRLVVADDERPARAFLLGLLAGCADVEVVGEAATGPEAVQAIETLAPDLALLDLQMPELGGLDVVRLTRRERLPLVAFVTAFDEYAVSAFELNAVDYLLKPVAPTRLRATLDRARARLGLRGWRAENAGRLHAAEAEYETRRPTTYLARIPVRRREDVLLVGVEQVASVEADGELLHLTTLRRERYTISHRLKDLEARLDPARFVRLSRGTLANLRAITKFSPLPGGTYVATRVNGQELQVSRSQGRLLREQLLRL